MFDKIIDNWLPVLALLGGLSAMAVIATACLIAWRKAGGGDIKAGPVDIDVDGKE